MLDHMWLDRLILVWDVCDDCCCVSLVDVMIVRARIVLLECCVPSHSFTVTYFSYLHGALMSTCGCVAVYSCGGDRQS